LSIVFLIINIKVPEYGGDEVWFAINLAYKDIVHLSLFEFVYSGPIKTIMTYFVFNIFGFNIYSVRCFSIATYVLGVIIWCIYLSKQKFWIALASSLILFSLNADLLFFAKVDINQPTFHNLFFIFHLIIFLIILKRGPILSISILFILFSFIESNLHIRNIWIMNAFVLAFIFDYYLFINRNLFSIKALKQFLLRAWPILFGWALSSMYFIYITVHFRSNPLVKMATEPGEKITYYESFIRSFHNLCDYVIGGRVFALAYSSPSGSAITNITGFIFLSFAVILFIVLFRNKRLPKHSWYVRMLIAMTCISLFIFLQYSITKYSIQAWHGNHLFLLSAILLALLIEGLFLIKLRTIAWLFIISISAVLISIQVLVSKQVTTMNDAKRGFDLVIWQPYSLTTIREYISNHPNSYLIADWEIGRPLLLENHYSSHKISTIEFYTAPLTSDIIKDLSNRLIIRSTSITCTVPDWSDDELIKFNAKFEKIKDFRDMYGREVYQLGYIRKIE
jgi:hypothetical protein